MDLNEIVIFLKVAQLQSFTRAAENLGIPKSTVSTKVTQLEKRLSVTLIHRTTRKINLTQIGQQFYDRCSESVQNLKSAEEEITFAKSAPSGKIKISAPVFLGAHFLPAIIADFKSVYPNVDIELFLTDRSVDLIGENVDLAIRSGHLQDSALIAKKIGVTHFSLFASPAYLKKYGKLSHPKDLKIHKCIQFTPIGRDKWLLVNPESKQTFTIPLKGEFLVDDIDTIKELVRRDQGIALLPAFSCIEDTKNKNLVAVLPVWRTDIRPIHFVYPSAKFQLPKLKQFISCADRIMRENLQII